MKKQRLSVIIIAKDEEENIRECLESVKWADEIIVVVDERTTDKTAAITKKYTDKVYINKFEGFGKQYQYALNKTAGDWVLKLDADERVTLALQKEILDVIKSDQFDAYHVFFQVFFLGKKLKLIDQIQGSVRLFGRNKGKFADVLIHEPVIIEGKVGKLDNFILHHSHRTISQTIDKFNDYTSLEAEQLFAAGARTNPFIMFVSPANAFWRQYFSWKAYRYGMHGFIMSIFAALYHLIKQLKIWEKQNKKGSRV